MQLLAQYRTVMNHISQGEVESALSFFAEDICLYGAVGMIGPLQGKENIAVWLASVAESHINTELKIFNSVERGAMLFVEGVDEFDSPEGQHVILPFTGVYEFRGDEICGWRDYFHGPLYKKALAGETPPDHVLELAQRPEIVVT